MEAHIRGATRPGPTTRATSTRTTGDTTLELAELLSHTARRLRRGSTTQLAPLGLTYAQARVLRLVAADGRPLRMADLAAALDVVPRSVTTMVDALEAAGLVARQPTPATALGPGRLSDDGRRLLDRLERGPAGQRRGGLRRPRRRPARHLLDLLGVLCAATARVSAAARPPAHDTAGRRAHAPGGAQATHGDTRR